MKKIFLIIMAVMLLTMTGCSNKDYFWRYYYFTGENEDWTGEYIENFTETYVEKNGRLIHDSDSDAIFKVTYQGDISELSSLRKIEISYQTRASGGSLINEYDESGPRDKTFTMRGSGTGIRLKEDDIIKVTINLDGRIQTMELKLDKRYSCTE